MYNLQTENGYYFINSIIAKSSGMYNGNVCAIAKNCRCTMISQVKGFETDVSDLSLRHDANLEGMTYEEWKNEHESKSNPLTLPEEKGEAIRQAYLAEYRKGGK